MRPQIVVVDDDPENCRALSQLLVTEGFDALYFEGGEAAWSAMESGQARPDVVVADVRMPGLDGVALLRRIKAQFPSIPVVLVSAFADETAWRDGLQAGAADVFPKPIHGASLVRALREVVRGGQSDRLSIGDNPGPRGAGTIQWRKDR